MIKQFTKKIVEGANFSFIKFGDSELLCMSGRPGSNGDNHPFSPDLCMKLNLAYEALSKQPETYFAEWTGPWKELYPHRNVSFVEYETILPTVHNSDLSGLHAFYKTIKESKRKKIYVGPARSRPVIDLLGIDQFIEVPLSNCWEKYDIVGTLLSLAIEPDCIVMFSCTMLANVMISDVYHGSITCLDCGSAFDPYCGIQNRERQMTPMEAKRYFDNGTLPNKSTIENTYFVHIRNPRTGEYYSSYNDYFRLVHLSGFQECDIEDVDPLSNNTYVFTLNYHGLNQQPIPDSFFPENRTARMILHQLERFNIIDDRFDQIWLYDRSMPELQHPKARYVMLGGHPDFIQRHKQCEKKYDFYHMCYLYGRRGSMIQELKDKGFTFADDDNEPWAIKNLHLQQAKIGLALHQHSNSLDLIEPLRMTVFACAGLPILAEQSKDHHPYHVYSYEEFLAHPDVDALASTSDSISSKVAENWKILCVDNTFKKCIEEALNR